MKRIRYALNVSFLLPRLKQDVVRGFHTLDHVLRRGDPGDIGFRAGSAARQNSTEATVGQLPLSKVVAIVIICGSTYGLAMGSYACVVGKRSFVEQIPQMIYSGIKVPLLIAITLMVSLPSFFVINTLLGLREDFREALRSIVSAQAGLTIILGSMFPLTVFAYVSLADAAVSYPVAVLFNAAMFGVASVSAQWLLRGYYERLIRQETRHRWMIRFWIIVYAFVGIQAAYVLRPFVGNPNQATTFFRRESFQNAYVKVLELIGNLLESINA